MSAMLGSLGMVRNMPQNIKDELTSIDVLMRLMGDKYSHDFRTHRWGDTLRHTFEYREDSQFANIITLTIVMDHDTYYFLGLILIQYLDVNKYFELNYTKNTSEEIIQAFKNII